MKIEPKMAIACRNRIEIDVALKMLEKAGINWGGGQTATKAEFMNDLEECRLYINSANGWVERTHIAYNEDPEDIEYDDEDGFEWIYVEASEMFKNQIISERRKRGVTTT